MSRLLALALVFLAAAPAFAAGVVVRVAPEVTVERDDLLVGDVATVEADETLAVRLRGLRLGPAPVVGAPHRIEGEVLRQRLRMVAPELARAQFVLPERVVVVRAAQKVAGDALVEAVRRRARAEGRGSDFALVPLNRPDDLSVPVGALTLDAHLVPAPPESLFLAASVVVRIGGRDVQTVPLTFRVGRYRDVVVAARALEPRVVLRPTDFRLESRVSTDVPADVLTALPDADDLEAVRPVPAGEALTARAVRPKIIVRRGETVLLVVEMGGLHITAQGQAVEDAHRGDSLRVLNVSSRREVVGRVESAGVVSIQLLAGGER